MFVHHPSGSSTPFSRDRARPVSVLGWLRTEDRRRAWLARGLFILLFALLLASAGCEVLTYERTDFPEAYIGADGQEIVLDKVSEIVSDAGLDEDEKRQELRDLGIEDEDLIDALLAG